MQSIKNHLIAVLFFTLIISAGFARPFALANNVKAAEWHDPDWTYRKLITIAAGKTSDDLSVFPVFIDLGDLGTDFFNNVKSDGTDILVTSDDGITKLSRELVDIDTGSETGELWFKAPSVSSSLDNEFYIYYGNASASESNDSATWNNNFEFVEHMNEDPGGSAPQFINSISGGRNGSTAGSMNSADLVDGLLGTAIDFDGTDDRIHFGNYTSRSTSYTMSVWFKDDGAAGTIVHRGEAGNCAYNPRLRTDNFTEEGCGSDNAFILTGISDTDWHMATATRNGNTFEAFVDGVSIGTRTAQNNKSFSSGTFAVGTLRHSSQGYQSFFDGLIDELKVSNTLRSDNWIMTEYNNQISPSTFYSVSNEESYGSAEIIISGISNNEWDGVSQTEVCFEYLPSSEFAASDAISLSFVPSFSSAVLDATPAEDDADGDTTSDGSFTSLTTDGATYTFTDATTQATTNGISLCLDLPAGQSINSHSISMTDTNGSFGATLLHVADNNDVTVTLEITPTLSFNIRTLDDSADTNTCDLGTIDTTTLPNTDTTDDGNGECGYSLAIGTNATSGFQVQITSDGDMDNASSSIINATEDQNIAAGAEAYGLINITAAQSGSDGAGNFDQNITKDGDFADDNDYTPVPQAPTNFVSYTDGVDYLAGTDNTDVTQVMHGMTVGSGTPAGLYQQVVTYTTTVTF